MEEAVAAATGPDEGSGSAGGTGSSDEEGGMEEVVSTTTGMLPVDDNAATGIVLSEVEEPNAQSMSSVEGGITEEDEDVTAAAALGEKDGNVEPLDIIAGTVRRSSRRRRRPIRTTMSDDEDDETEEGNLTDFYSEDNSKPVKKKGNAQRTNVISPTAEPEDEEEENEEDGTEFALRILRTDESRIFVIVDEHLWDESLPMQISPTTARHYHPRQWSPAIKSFFPNWDLPIYVYYVPRRGPPIKGLKDSTPPSQISFQIVGLEVHVREAANVVGDILTRIETSVPQWHREINTRVPTLGLPGVLGGSAPPSSVGGVPSLLTLLDALHAEGLTTTRQRQQIKHVVLEYLGNEISLTRLYTALGTIVGYGTLKAVIRALTATTNPPTTTTAGVKRPMSSIYAAVEHAYQLDEPKGAKIARVEGKERHLGHPSPIYMFTQNDMDEIFVDKSETYKQLCEVHDKPIWVSIPQSEHATAIPFRWGHKIIDLDEEAALVIGGTGVSPNDKSSALESIEGMNGWKYAVVVRKDNFDRCKMVELKGACVPEASIGYSLCEVYDTQGARGDVCDSNRDLLVFGGAKPALIGRVSKSGQMKPESSDLSEFIPTNRLWRLHLVDRQWNEIGGFETYPSERFGHFCIPIGDEIETLGMLVGGGVGHKNGTMTKLVDDFWFYDLKLGHWKSVKVRSSSSEGGGDYVFAQMLRLDNWRNWICVCCHDFIENKITNKSDQSLCLFDIKLEENEVILDINLIYKSPSSFPFMSFLLNVSADSIQINKSLNATKTVLLQVDNFVPTQQIHLMDISLRDDKMVQVTNPRIISVGLSPFEPKTEPESLSYGASAFYNVCPSYLSSRKPKKIPAIYLFGGVKLDSEGSPSSPVIGHSMLSLLRLDPFDLSWFSSSKIAAPRRADESSETAGGLYQDENEVPPSDMGVPMSLRDRIRKSRLQATTEIQNVGRLHEETMQLELSLTQPPEWLSKPSFTPGIMSALGTMTMWPFAAFGNLIENSSALTMRTTHMSFQFMFNQSGDPFLCVTDNGRGLTYSATQRLLREFANWERLPEARDRTKRSGAPLYGLGFKLALSRLAESVMVITKTKGSVGVGFVSSELDYHTNSTPSIIPTIFWKVPTKELIGLGSKLSQSARNAQALIYSYSPFTTPESLADQINFLKDGTGTRIIFWNFKLKQTPTHVSFDVQNPSLIRLAQQTPKTATTAGADQQQQHSTSIPYSCTTYLMPPPFDKNVGTAASLYPLANGNEWQLANVSVKITTNTTTTSTEGEDPLLCSLNLSGGNSNNFLCAIPCRRFGTSSSQLIYQVNGLNVTNCDARLDARDLLWCPEYLSKPYKHTVDLIKQSKKKRVAVKLKQSKFPFWANSIDSIDHCLNTYVFWCQLFSTVTYWVNEKPLISVSSKFIKHNNLLSPASASPPGTNNNTEVPINDEMTTTNTVAVSGVPNAISAVDPTDKTTSTVTSRKKRSIANTAAAAATTGTTNSKKRKLPSLEEPKEESTSRTSSPSKNPKLTNPGDPFRRSLGRFLKQRLNCMVELDYLFTASDSQQGCWGLMGFVNAPNDLVGQPSDSLELQEAGILLYHRERLIRRLFVPFPAPPSLLENHAKRKYPESHFNGEPEFLFPCTAVINVPDWMYPCASREGFICERSVVFDTFVLKMKSLINSYLRVCRNSSDRIEWLMKRRSALLDYLGWHHPLSIYYHLACYKDTAPVITTEMQDEELDS